MCINGLISVPLHPAERKSMHPSIRASANSFLLSGTGCERHCLSLTGLMADFVCVYDSMVFDMEAMG